MSVILFMTEIMFLLVDHVYVNGGYHVHVDVVVASVTLSRGPRLAGAFPIPKNGNSIAIASLYLGCAIANTTGFNELFVFSSKDGSPANIGVKIE